MAGKRTTVTIAGVTGVVSSGVGARAAPVAGASTDHKGIDIPAAVGTPLTSDVAGRVTFAGQQRGYGNFIEVTGSDGKRYRFAHLNSINVRQGQTVRVGDRLGATGKSGNVSGAHLHYEVLDSSGRVLNPLTNTPTNYTVGSAAAASPTPSGPVFSLDDQAQLRTALDRDDEYYPNYLNSFYGSTYHIKFFMVDGDTYGEKLDRVGSLNPREVANIIDSANKVIIAESGVTAGINIKSMSFTCIPQQEDKRSDGTTFEMTIVEPLGTAFYDLMTSAATELNIQDFKDSPYFIEITFKGYDEDGNPCDNVLSGYAPTMDSGAPSPEFENGGRWIYRVTISTVETQVTQEGSTHQLTMVSGLQPGTAGQDGRAAPEMMNIRGNTLGEMLDSLKEQLEETQQRRYPSGKKLHSYDFAFEKNDAVKLPSDPRQWSLLDDPKLFTNASGLAMQDGKPVMQISADHNITTIIKSLIANTKEAQRLAIGTDTVGNTKDSGPAKARHQIMPSIAISVSFGEFNQTWRTHAKRYDYKIMFGYYDNLIADVTQLSDAKSGDIQKEMVAKLRQRGLLRKRFDYLYTGMNTEVKNLEIKFAMNWSGVLPNVVGWASSIDQAQTNAMFNTDAGALNKNLTQEYQTLMRDRAEAASELANRVNQATKGLETQARVIGGEVVGSSNSKIPLTNDIRASVARVNNIEARRLELVDKIKVNEYKLEQDRTPTKTSKTEATTTYAEDLTSLISSSYDARMVLAVANNKERTVGMAGPYHRDRSIFGALMDQIAGNTANMMEIDLEIRGDPYWMGSANLEQSPQPSSSQVAPLGFGHVVFLLKVSYPFNYTDDNDQSNALNFRTFGSDDTYRQDAFSGFYLATKVENIFSDGEFSQRIKAVRHQMIELAKVFDFGSVEGQFDNGLSQQADGGGGGEAVINDGAPAAPLPAKVEDRAKVLYKKLKDMNFSDVQIAAILGSWQQESTLNPTASNSNGGAYGLAQWYDRKPALLGFARARGLNPGSVDTQLAFFQHELATTESKAGRNLKAATTLDSAMKAMNSYERFGTGEYKSRGVYMNQHYQNITQGKYN